MISNTEIDRDDFLNLLGVDYEKTGKLVKIICPFHDDTHPSLNIYPDIDRSSHCFACGETYSWPWILAKVRGIPFPEACRMLELPDGEYGGPSNSGKIKIDLNFCNEPVFVDQFTKKHEQCSKDYPPSMVKWLEKKGLTGVASKLDWRWHDGTVFKKWGKGIVIPYKKNGEVIWERFRGEVTNGLFQKPIGPVDIGIQPYFGAYRKNDTVYLVEGESDAASVYYYGGSAIGIPGAKAKKAINTVACFIADHEYITRVVLCGDEDAAGQDMNRLYREALNKFVERPLEIIEYEHQFKDKKADVNDDHTRGIMSVPIQWTSYYGYNHERNYGVFGSHSASEGPEQPETLSYKERMEQWLKKRIMKSQ